MKQTAKQKLLRARAVVEHVEKLAEVDGVPPNSSLHYQAACLRLPARQGLEEHSMRVVSAMAFRSQRGRQKMGKGWNVLLVNALVEHADCLAMLKIVPAHYGVQCLVACLLLLTVKDPVEHSMW